MLNEVIDQLQASQDNTCEVSPDWAQGRALFGGIVGSLALTGIAKELEQPKPLRSFLASFLAPVAPGQVRVESQVAREGKNVTQATAEVISGDQVCFHGLAAYGVPRDTLTVPAGHPFKPEPRESVPLLEPHEMMPKFLSHFDCHWTGGGVPMSGENARRLGLWVRHKSDMSKHPLQKLVAVADFPPPVIMSHYTRPIIGSSLTWSLDFVVEPETVESEWFYLDYQVDAAAHGYCQQSGLVFDEQGQLCALSRQCMVYFE